ncbi:MAG: sulfatase [Candidatus Coatesbacteria bacterium]|nr:MAG: sulfatase [Candidatus Coatesbacteria bacterium]
MEASSLKEPRRKNARVPAGPLGAVKVVAAAAFFFAAVDTLFVRVIFFGAHFSDYSPLTYFGRSAVLYLVAAAAAAVVAAALRFGWNLVRPSRRPSVAGAAAGGAVALPALAVAILVNRASPWTITHPAMVAVDVAVFAGWATAALEGGARLYRWAGPGGGRLRRVVWFVVGYGGIAAFAFLILGLFAGRSLTRPAPPERAPNVLLITIDALRKDRLACYGYERVATPRLGAFADSGATFEYAYSNSPWTLPSMASLLTGRYPSVCGVDAGHKLRAGIPTLAERLRAEGYRTEAYVTNIFMHPEYGFASGFDVYLMNGDFRLLYPLRGTALYKFTVAAARAARSRSGRRRNNTTFNSAATAAALRRLGSGRRPFFVWCHFMDPHGPYTPPRGYVPDYPGVEAAEAYTLMDDLLARGWGLDELPMEEAEVRKFEMLYDGEVAYVDEHFGKIMETLEAEGLADDTIVVVLTDHGEEFFDHGGFEHGHTLYPELIDMALLVRLPGYDLREVAARRYVSQVDVVPSIMEALGFAPPRDVDGRSFLGGDPEEETAAFAEAVKRGTEKKALRRGGWLYIEDWEEGTRELYNIAADPRAVENVAGTGLPVEEELAEAIRRYVAANENEVAGGGAAPELSLPEEQKRRLVGLGYIAP